MTPDRRSFLKTAALAALANPGAAPRGQPAVGRVSERLTPGRWRGVATGTGGLSPARLARMHDTMAGHVASGRLPGLVTLISRRGEITAEQKAASEFSPDFWDSRGWGFGVSVITRRDEVASVPGRFGWDGGYGTSWYVDPKEDMVGILMTQRVWDSPGAPVVYLDFWTSAYQAIDD